MGNESQEKMRQLAEEFGIFFEKMGSPRVAGRIWGWLLTCRPSHQSAAEIAEGVNASRGSVSMMTRLLIQLGLIERVGIPGQRSGFYRVRAGGFAEMVRAEMRFTTDLRMTIERGLKSLEGEPPEVRRHLQECRDCCAFFERELPALIERWEKEREER